VATLSDFCFWRLFANSLTCLPLEPSACCLNWMLCLSHWNRSVAHLLFIAGDYPGRHVTWVEMNVWRNEYGCSGGELKCSGGGGCDRVTTTWVVCWAVLAWARHYAACCWWRHARPLVPAAGRAHNVRPGGGGGGWDDAGHRTDRPSCPVNWPPVSAPPLPPHLLDQQPCWRWLPAVAAAADWDATAAPSSSCVAVTLQLGRLYDDLAVLLWRPMMTFLGC